MSLDFDDAEFYKLSASLDSVFPEILDVFFEETENSLKELNSNLAEENMGQIQDIAHKIKSSSKTFGASGLATLLETIESLNADDFEQCELLNQQINQEFQLVKEHILNNLQ